MSKPQGTYKHDSLRDRVAQEEQYLFAIKNERGHLLERVRLLDADIEATEKLIGTLKELLPPDEGEA